ncbi:MAG: toll/interleukin-1 receptor domain-containing protein [Caldilineaceae bacterium]|nr:toll/interleukin-1 receptor domain-containing protein [Caldilineaceae bacterium]
MFRVFLSYSSKDRRYAENIANALGAQGIDVSYDTVAITPGESFQQSIADAILESSAVVAIVSPNYSKSNWCQFEAELAVGENRPVIPILVQGDVSNSPFRYLNHLNYVHLSGSESERAAYAASLIKRSLDQLATPLASGKTDSGEVGES